MASKKSASKSKKSTPKKSGSKKLTAPAQAPATHTWEALLHAVHAPSKEQRLLYAIRTAPAELVDRGTHIRSEKILTDTVRLYGVAAEFWAKAAADQKRHLLGFSEALLRVAVYSAVELRDLVARRDAAVGARESAIAVGASAAAKDYADGMAERDRLATAIDAAVEGDVVLETRLDAARGRVVDAGSLAISLSALAKLAHELLHEKGSPVAAQLADGGLTNAEVKGAEALAAKVKASGALASGARAQGAVSQGDLDLQDGVCLAYLERVMKIFNGGHDRDPSIPQLLPIATRRLFSPNRKRAGDTATAGAATGATGAKGDEGAAVGGQPAVGGSTGG
jgi:hypothetical protein